MLCDVAKVHTGYGIMPAVTHTTDDENWGKIGFSKKVYAAKSLTQKGGWASNDTVLERIENKYWKIEVSNFQAWMLGFTKFTGEWQSCFYRLSGVTHLSLCACCRVGQGAGTG